MTNTKFPQLKVGQVGYYNGNKIIRASRTHYIRNGLRYTKGELVAETLKVA